MPTGTWGWALTAVADINRHHALNVSFAECSNAKHSGKSGVLAGHPTAGLLLTPQRRSVKIFTLFLHIWQQKLQQLVLLGAYLNIEQTRKPKHKLLPACLVQGFASDVQLTNLSWLSPNHLLWPPQFMPTIMLPACAPFEWGEHEGASPCVTASSPGCSVEGCMRK